VFIAEECRRPLRPFPDRVAVSVITLGELRLGVLRAATAIDLAVPVVTQDSDYDEMAKAHRPLKLLRV
jgi:predicted nucleic acid-binding protein